MSIADTATSTRPDPPIVGETHPSATVPPDVPIRRRVAVISAAVLLIVLVATAVFQLFQGPVASAWYDMRQRALAAQFTAAEAHSGRGNAIAIVQIPRIDLNVVVADGSSPAQLRGGPGHHLGTTAPGLLGNSVIVGHRNGWGGPFRHLSELKEGDSIAVETYTPDAQLQTAVYDVRSVGPARADDPRPFAKTDDYRLTLITGRGDRFSEGRFVVTAVSGTPTKKTSTDARARTAIVSERVGTSSSGRLALLPAVGAILAWFLLRRRYHLAATLAVVVPLAALSLLGVLLSTDLLLAPLR